jgi:hypothetical protein
MQPEQEERNGKAGGAARVAEPEQRETDDPETDGWAQPWRTAEAVGTVPREIGTEATGVLPAARTGASGSTAKDR